MDEARRSIEEKKSVKKTYTPPKLLEYGSITKLTQAAGTGAVDTPGMMVCL